MTANEAKPEDRQFLQDLGGQIKGRLPDGWGFFLLAAPFGDTKSRAVYVSNMKRESAINCMKEWLIKCSASEDWMKHIN